MTSIGVDGQRDLAAAEAYLTRAEAVDDDVLIGLFAPTAPFEGTGDRVSFVNGLADHLVSESGGKKVTGKVFSSASAFSSAVRKGEIQFAVVDAPYARGPLVRDPAQRRAEPGRSPAPAGHRNLPKVG